MFVSGIELTFNWLDIYLVEKKLRSNKRLWALYSYFLGRKGKKKELWRNWEDYIEFIHCSHFQMFILDFVFEFKGGEKKINPQDLPKAASFSPVFTATCFSGSVHMSGEKVAPTSSSGVPDVLSRLTSRKIFHTQKWQAENTQQELVGGCSCWENRKTTPASHVIWPEKLADRVMGLKWRRDFSDEGIPFFSL